MYAIIRTGGKQFKVEKEQKLTVPYLTDYKSGDEIDFKDVLLFKGEDESIKIGAPALSNITVKGKILNHGKDAKLVVMKFKKRKRYKRKNGHRQLNSCVKITDIIVN